MKIQIENLKAQLSGKDLSHQQRGDAMIELGKLIGYIESLESNQISIQRAEKYARMQHYLGAQDKDFVEFKEWEDKQF